jgi:hypothetical protein
MEKEIDHLFFEIMQHFAVEDIKNLVAEAAKGSRFKTKLHLAKNKKSQVVCIGTKRAYPFQLKLPAAPNRNKLWNLADYYESYNARRQKAMDEVQYLSQHQPDVGETRNDVIGNAPADLFQPPPEQREQYFQLVQDRDDELRDALASRETDCLRNEKVLEIVRTAIEFPLKDEALKKHQGDDLVELYKVMKLATEKSTENLKKLMCCWVRFLSKMMEYYLMFMSKYAWDLGVPLKVAKDYTKNVHIFETLLHNFRVNEGLLDFLTVMDEITVVAQGHSTKTRVRFNFLSLVYMKMSECIIKEFWETRRQVFNLSHEQFLKEPTSEQWEAHLDAFHEGDIDSMEWIAGWLAGNRIERGLLKNSIPSEVRDLVQPFLSRNVKKGSDSSSAQAGEGSIRRGSVDHLEKWGGLSRVSDSFFSFFLHSTIFFYFIMRPEFVFHYNHLHPAQLCEKAILKSKKIQEQYWLCFDDRTLPKNYKEMELSNELGQYGALYRYLLKGFLNCHLKDRYLFLARNIVKGKKFLGTRDSIGVASTLLKSDKSQGESGGSGQKRKRGVLDEEDEEENDEFPDLKEFEEEDEFDEERQLEELMKEFS